MTNAQPCLSASGRARASVEAAYARGRVVGESGREFPTFPTGLRRECGELLAELVEEENASRTIETGLGLGLSTLFILGALDENGVRGPACHTAIDPFQKRDWDNAALKLVYDSGCIERLRFFAEDSALVLPALVSAGERFDFAFVDGGHLFENVFIDLVYMTRLVQVGGLIVVDDAWMPAVKAAVGYLVSNLGARLEPPSEKKAGSRLIILRNAAPPKRKWDHFEPFW